MLWPRRDNGGKCGRVSWAARAPFSTRTSISNSSSPEDPEISVVGRLFRPATRSEFVLLFPADVASELTQVIGRRPYLATRISEESLDALFEQIRVFATPLPLLEQVPPRLSRDPNDDYLIALAVLNAADYLVTRGRGIFSIWVMSLACILSIQWHSCGS